MFSVNYDQDVQFVLIHVSTLSGRAAVTYEDERVTMPLFPLRTLAIRDGTLVDCTPQKSLMTTAHSIASACAVRDQLKFSSISLTDIIVLVSKCLFWHTLPIHRLQ